MRDELLDPVQPAQRRLTTILAADAQGYSRLMEADEEGTLATLKDYRDAMGRLIAAHHGRVVNTWGDAVIAEFASVVEAVRAAIDIQNELAGRNATRPGETRMHFRIGINLGDVIADGSDIYGDGVNIAARLQSEAPPGGILISSTVYDQVRNKVAVGFDFRGDLEVKNVDQPVKSYAIRIGAAEPRPAAEAPPTPAEPQDGRARDDGSARAETRPERTEELAKVPPAPRQLYTGLGIAAAVVVAINLLSGGGSFWAKWPLLAIGFAAGMNWARSTRDFDRRLAMLAVAGAGLVAINLMTWGGSFWAKWPLLALAIAAGVRWARKGRWQY